MSSELATTQPVAITAQQQDNSLGTVIQWAMEQKATVEQMRELYAFNREIKADQAREAFNRAFSAFKSRAITIVKGTDVKAGPLAGSKYANLYDVVKAVTPSLSEYELSHSWKLTKDEPGWMEVTCTISHALGHSESVSMGAAPDKGPGRNDIQARGSAKTYLERYTLLAATGLTASDADDDGNGGEGPHESNIRDYTDALNAATTKEELKQLWEKADAFALSIKDLKLRKRWADLKDTRKAAL